MVHLPSGLSFIHKNENYGIFKKWMDVEKLYWETQSKLERHMTKRHDIKHDFASRDHIVERCQEEVVVEWKIEHRIEN